MASQKALREQNWAGKVSLKLVLASTEVTTLDTPSPLFALATRLGYLPSVADQALEYFQDVLPPGPNTPWFEYKRVPLPWHIPVGVLHDLLASRQEEPWHLTIHFRAFPADVLMRWEGEQTLRAAHFNSMKEAAYICQGSAAAVMGMTAQAQDDLWAAIMKGDYGQYEPVSGSLQLVPRARGERRPSVPLRLYVMLAQEGGYVSSLASATRYTSRPVEALTPGSPAARSLGDVLAALLPPLSQQGAGGGPERGVAQGSGGDGAAAAAASAAATHQAGQAQAEGEDKEAEAAGSGGGQEGLEQQAAAAAAVVAEGRMHLHGRPMEVLVGGVSVSLEAPVAWLHANLAHSDHFLYVAVVPCASQEAPT